MKLGMTSACEIWILAVMHSGAKARPGSGLRRPSRWLNPQGFCSSSGKKQNLGPFWLWTDKELAPSPNLKVPSQLGIPVQSSAFCSADMSRGLCCEAGPAVAAGLVLRVEGRAGGGGLNLIQQKVLTSPGPLTSVTAGSKSGGALVLPILQVRFQGHGLDLSPQP